MSENEPIYLVDGNAYIYRAYHAISPLTNSSGLPTHAVLGFTNILLRVIREKNPRYLAVAFDLKGPTFRNEIFADYKANRPPMPDDLICQIPYIKDIVAAYNIVCLEKSGVEADDLIASAARRLADNGHKVVMVSGDKDLLQLVSEDISFWDPMNDRFMDQAGVLKKYNVSSDRLLDFFALIGDKSDNVPGVPGVGPKTAEKLINRFGSLDRLYEALDEVDNVKLKEKLSVNRNEAFLARRLIRLKEDLEVGPRPEDYLLPAANEEKLRDLFTFLGFARLLKKETSSSVLDYQGFKLVRTSAELKSMVSVLGKADFLVLDTETTSLDPLSAELVGVSLCCDTKEAFYIPLAHRDLAGVLGVNQLALAEVVEGLRPLLEKIGLPKLGHNLKFDYSVLLTQGITLAGPLWDSMIASYLIDPSRRSHKLDDLCEEYLHKRLTSFKEIVGEIKKNEGSKEQQENFAFVEIEAARDYSCEDVHGSLLLWEYFRPQLEAQDLWDLFVKVEMETVPVLARMERNGIKVEVDVLRRMSAEFSDELVRLEAEIFRLAGEPFNINSPQQLGAILFEKLNLPHGRKTKTGYSTDVKVLEKLSSYHDLPATVISYRNLTKLKSTYVDNLLTQIHPVTGRIHTSFNQTVTATGRLSSSNPNLQNIPIRTPEGQRIREAFVAEAGHRFLAADYSQIDLRVLAHYSQDPVLLAAFRSDQDIHKHTAAEIFRVTSQFITDQMRRVAKTINFGIVYGMSAFGLAEQLNLSRKEAAVFIERYFEHYGGVKTFMTEIIEKARAMGYVTTLLKRRRPLPDINSSNKTRREFAERTAINTPIQGTAADIIKLATIEAEKQLTEKGFGAKLLLQIHDELVFEVPENEFDKTADLVKNIMESVFEIDVPLVVNVSGGKSLAET